LKKTNDLPLKYKVNQKNIRSQSKLNHLKRVSHISKVQRSLESLSFRSLCMCSPGWVRVHGAVV